MLDLRTIFRRPGPVLLAVACFLGAAGTLLASPDAGSGAEPLRLASEAFGSRVEIEVRDLPREEATRAIQAAVEEMLEVESLVAPDGKTEGGLGELNAAAGKKPQAVDSRLLRLLARARDFCIWSRGAHGPLGGRLYELWGLRERADSRPTPSELASARATASCDGLALDARTDRAQLAPGARLELWGFAAGFAVDRAVEVLRELGVRNAWVQLGDHCYGLGPGPGGRGWAAQLPVLDDPGLPQSDVYLRDRALTTRRFDERALEIAGDSYPSLIDQRSGLPPEGIESVTVVTDISVDAQALAASLMILGNREGQMRLGALRPKPAVLWLLGDGSGKPVLATYQWSQLLAMR